MFGGAPSYLAKDKDKDKDNDKKKIKIGGCEVMCLAVLRLIWLMPTRPRLPARVCLLGPITLPSFVEDAPEQLGRSCPIFI